MFDSFYPFFKLNKRLPNYQHNKYDYVDIYYFDGSSNERYLVEVEVYEKYFLYVVKFYRRKDKNIKHKFNINTNLNEATPIIRTCINIMLTQYKKNVFASFGFIGANSLAETSKENTKRFRIYSKVMQNMFSLVEFEHIVYGEGSAYLMLNRHTISNNATILQEIESVFRPLFD